MGYGGWVGGLLKSVLSTYLPVFTVEERKSPSNKVFGDYVLVRKSVLMELISTIEEIRRIIAELRGEAAGP